MGFKLMIMTCNFRSRKMLMGYSISLAIHTSDMHAHCMTSPCLWISGCNSHRCIVHQPCIFGGFNVFKATVQRLLAEVLVDFENQRFSYLCFSRQFGRQVLPCRAVSQHLDWSDEATGVLRHCRRDVGLSVMMRDCSPRDCDCKVVASMLGVA